MMQEQLLDEHLIKTIQLKRGILKITNRRLIVDYQSKYDDFEIDIKDVRALTPVGKNNIRVQYIIQDEQGRRKRHQIIVDLPKQKETSLTVCYNILEMLFNENIFTKHTKGLLYLKNGEEVIDVINDCKSSEGQGKLYITNQCLVMETSKGIVFDAPYELIKLITELKKNQMKVIWKEYNNKNDVEYKFSLRTPNKIDISQVISVIKETMAEFEKKSDFTLRRLYKKYMNMTPDEIYQIGVENNSLFFNDYPKETEFVNFLKIFVKKVWGWSDHVYLKCDRSLLFACMTLGINYMLIYKTTEKEKEERKFARDFVKEHYNGLLQTHFLPIHNKINALRESIGDGYENNVEYIQLVNQFEDLKVKHSKELEDAKNKEKIIQHTAWKFYDRRVKIIYQEWCKTHPLTDYTDVKSNDWLEYLINILNNEKGRNTIQGNLYEFLNERLNIKNRNESTLHNFSPPAHIPKEDIYNNCWFDKQYDMWYTSNDNLNEKLREKVDSDLDESQSNIGLRVWGFKKEKVTMVCGWPTVTITNKNMVGDYKYVINYGDREEGKNRMIRVLKDYQMCIPILNDDDINEKMVVISDTLIDDYNEPIDMRVYFKYETSSIQFAIRTDGDYVSSTVTKQNLSEQLWNFVDIPLAERIRRFIFSINTDLYFAPTVPANKYETPINSDELFYIPKKTINKLKNENRFESLRLNGFKEYNDIYENVNKSNE